MKTPIMVLPPTPAADVRAAELAENDYFRTAKAIRRYSTHFFNTYSIMRRSILHLAIVAIAGLSFASAQAQDGSDAPILRDNRVDTAILSRPINPKMTSPAYRFTCSASTGRSPPRSRATGSCSKT